MAKGIIDTYSLRFGSGVEYYPGFALLIDRELWDVVGVTILVEAMFLRDRFESRGFPVYVEGKLVQRFWKNSGFFLRLLRALSVRLRAIVLLDGKVGLASLIGNGSSIIRSGRTSTLDTTWIRKALSSLEYPGNSSSLDP